MGKRRCRECGSSYENSFQHCPVCGADRGRRLPRCPECGSRLASGHVGRCPICGASLSHWRARLAVVAKLLVAVAVVAFFAATYLYGYLPALSALPRLPEPIWPTATPTMARPTATQTPSHTPTATLIPTRTRIPTNTPVPATPTRPAPKTYVVEFGDNLIGIAERFNTSVEALMIANGLTDRDLIREEQILIIPTGTPTPQ